MIYLFDFSEIYYYFWGWEMELSERSDFEKSERKMSDQSGEAPILIT